MEENKSTTVTTNLFSLEFNEEDTKSVNSTNVIPFMEIETLQRKYSEVSNGRKSLATFSPLIYLHSGETGNNDVTLSKLPFTDKTLASAYNKNKKNKRQKQKRVKILLFLGVIIFILCTSSSLTYYFLRQDGENLEVDNYPSCSIQDAEKSRKLISENAYFAESFLHIENIELSCFPQQPFSQVTFDFSVLDQIFFSNLTVGLIEKDVFGAGLGMNIGAIHIINSTVDIFLDQNQNLQLIFVGNSEIKEYPSDFPSEQIIFTQARNFEFSSREVSLITSSPKNFIQFNIFLDTQSILQLRNILIAEGKKITLRSLTSGNPVLSLSGNFIRTIPEDFFGSKILDVQSEQISIFINGDGFLQDIEEGAFKGNEHVGIELSFAGCEVLEELPEEIRNVNLTNLDITGSGISNFDGFDFSVFQSLRSIFVDGTEVASECTELDSFKAKYGIHQEVFPPKTHSNKILKKIELSLLK
eukprot:snap_masked-scaffold_38-processed-gene-1.51-mRNA-1 protein AED:1.00 eAED:1.00 QI:0/0/0/0/1/1/2/0/470